MLTAPRGRFAVIVAAALLAVGCDQTSPPGLGDLRVVAATSGEDVDPDGYAIAVDDEARGPLGPDGENTIPGLGTGEHEVMLSGLASNCGAADNPRITVVVGNDVVTEEFEVTCEGRRGDILVTTVTTGASIDADGYLVHVGNGAPVAVPANGSVTLSGIAEGAATVTLSGEAANCIVSQSIVPTVIVFRSTAEVQFGVECTPAGTLRTAVTTLGSHAPTSGYRFTMAWYTAPMHESRALAPTDAVEWVLPAGEWNIYLSGVSPNCTIEGGYLRTVTLSVDAVVDVAFQVNCVAPQLVAFAGSSGESEEWDIYTVSTNGAGLRRLTTDPASDAQPDWSPDGATIAFTSSRGGSQGIYVMNADGSGQRRLSGDATESEPAWSPDGSRIAFTRREGETADIWLMDAAGGNTVRVTDDPAADSEPTWSPDGARIAFIRAHADGSSHLYVMNADGSGVERLTSEAGWGARWSPQWSPDGDRIAVTVAECAIGCGFGIWFVAVDGAYEPYPILMNGSVIELSWSPDGEWIVFATGMAIWATSADTRSGGPVHSGPAYGVDWRP